MANRHKRKVDSKLERRVKAFETDKGPHKHEQHKPGSQNLRNQ